MNSSLSICIPTYNRQDKLASCIRSLLPQIRDHKIPVYISDNASDDNTRGIVQMLKQEYPYIFYSRNETNLGADVNFEKVLQLSTTDFSWLLSDDDKISDGAIDHVLTEVKAQHDIIVVNGCDGLSNVNDKSQSRVKNVPSKIINDKDELLAVLGWHMTWMSCLIFSKEVIQNANFLRFRGSYLLQFGIGFDYLASKDSISVYWISDNCTYADSVPGQPSWMHLAFDIWVKSWYETIYNLPEQYSRKAKLQCIKAHGTESGLFSLKMIYDMRKKSFYNFGHFYKYLKYWKHVTDVPLSLMLIVSVLPMWLIKTIKKIRE